MKLEIISKIEQLKLSPKVQVWLCVIASTQNRGGATGEKMKGVGVIEGVNGEVWLADVHWYKAIDIGRKKEKEKRKIRRLVQNSFLSSANAV